MMLNKYERNGYAYCVLDYKRNGLAYCKDMSKRLEAAIDEDNKVSLDLHRGYLLALADIKDESILI